MAEEENEADDKCERVLEARTVYLLMKKEYRISRSIRMQWFLDHLNKYIKVPDKDIFDENERDAEDQPELRVISVIPQEQPPDWEPESSHLYKYIVTSHSTLFFLAHKYCTVYCLDMSPSLSAVDIQHGEIMLDEVFAALKKSLQGLAKPFKIPGSTVLFQPEIFVTVIAHTPFFTTPAQQVLVQGWKVTEVNLPTFLSTIEKQLRHLENTVAEVAAVAYDQLEALRAESEKLVGGLFEESSDGGKLAPPAARVPMVGPDAGFVNMLRYGMLALRLLPESSCKNLIMVTDGVVASPDVHVLDSVLAQLRSGTVSCSFLHVGSPFHPHCCSGFVPYIDLMQFISDATCGEYINVIPDVSSKNDDTMNVYHEKILTWKFQKNNNGSLFGFTHWNPALFASSFLRAGEWNVSNSCFYGSQEPNLLRKKQEEDNLSASLPSVLCCRLREGYRIKNVNIVGGSQVEVILVLPWKNHIYIEYTVTCQWPPMQDANMFISGIYSPSGVVHYSISIVAPYEFLHDITCLLKKPFKSPYREAVVSRFWNTLKNLNKSDQLLVHIHSFLNNPSGYTVPESIRSGMPVFYLQTNSSVPVLVSSNTTCPQFAHFWRPICLLEPSVWKKWLHTHRVGLLLRHDHPLPKYLHLANSSGRFQVVQCRQAAAALYSLLKDWSSFVLIENHSYVKFIHGDSDKPPTSFYLIRVTSKPPCVVINVAFLTGTPAALRYKIVEQLKQRIKELTFPHRPSTKDSISRSGMRHSNQQAQDQQAPQQKKSTEINCCVLLHKPVEKILIRYERVPSDFSTVVFPDGTTPLAPGSQSKPRTSGSGLLTTLSRYLHHTRWIWATQGGPDEGDDAVANILATITKMRLQEGFSFAHSTSGIINMVLEVQMKGEVKMETEVGKKESEWNENLHPCVIQYVMFPPHMTTTNSKESGSEDEGTDDVEIQDSDGDGELQIITECWIEPQHGVVVDCPPERSYLENLPYHKLADVIASQNLHKTSLNFTYLNMFRRRFVSIISSCPTGWILNMFRRWFVSIINCPNGPASWKIADDADKPSLKHVQICRVDSECISSLLTFQHLSLLCSKIRVRSPMAITSANGVLRCSPLDFHGRHSPHIVTLAEQRIHYIPFAFNLMNILPKCQQAELLYSLFIQDLNLEEQTDLVVGAPNKLLIEHMFEQLKQNCNKEIQLTLEDSLAFLQLLYERKRTGCSYSLPIPQLPQLIKPSDLIRIPVSPHANSITSEVTMCDKVPHGPLAVPKWRCFLKGVSNKHIALAFLPASYADLKSLMLPNQSLENVHPGSVKMTRQGESPMEDERAEIQLEQNNTALSRSSSCDTSCIFNKLPIASHLQSDSCSPLSFDQFEFLSDAPFRMRASSWDTVTKHTLAPREANMGLDRVRTGSMDSKIKLKHIFVGPSLRLRDVATDMQESKKPSDGYQLESTPPLQNTSPSTNQDHKTHISKYGSITFPIYIYDCPMHELMDLIVSHDTHFESGNKGIKDIYMDHTFKVEGAGDSTQSSLRDGVMSSKTATREHIETDRDEESDQAVGDTVIEMHIPAKHSSPEPKSEDSEDMPEVPCLSQLCAQVSLAYCKVFVYTIFKSLHLNYSIEAQDVQAAVDECEEALIEIDITDFIKTVCGHLKDFRMKARVDEMKLRSAGSSPQIHDQDAMTLPAEASSEAPTEALDSVDTESPAAVEQSTELEPRFPLSLLHTHAPCQELDRLHKHIKAKFMQILTVAFRPVPSHPEFYFCTPNWEKSSVPEHPADLSAPDEGKGTELDDELDNMTYHSEIEFRSEHGSGIGAGVAWETQTPDDARTSLLSNMDSDSLSDLADEEITEEVSPLFLHLTCSVHSKGKINSHSVRVLPTCLGELIKSWDAEETEIDLNDLQVTLDIICLTLSAEAEEADAAIDQNNEAAEAVTSEEFDQEALLSLEDPESGVPCSNFCTAEMLESPNARVSDNQLEVINTYNLQQLRHLPDYQRKAVTSCVEEIKWLMRDEIAAFLLDTFPLEKATLNLVAEHVKNSPGRPSCLMEVVPLQFVFGPEHSLERFLQEFRNLVLNGYHLCQEDDFYYLVRDKRSTSASASMSASASDPVTGGVERKKANEGLLPSIGMKLQPMYQPGHMADQAELWTEMRRPTTAGSSEENVLTEEFGEIRTEADDSDTDDDTRQRTRVRTRNKPHVVMNDKEDSELSPKFNPQLDGLLRTTSGSDDKEIAVQETSTPSELLSPSEDQNAEMRHSHSYSLSDEGPGRESSLSRWSAVAAWQRRQMQQHQQQQVPQQQQHPPPPPHQPQQPPPPPLPPSQSQQPQQQVQGTPGHRSEVSSIVESALGTEDGYEGYEGDSSDSADECDWLQDLDMRRPSLPNFWLIMKVEQNAVTTYFHSRCPEGEEEAPYRNVQRSMVTSIKRLCKVVNQTMLLQNLHDTRMCNQLLEPEASEDIWKAGSTSAAGSESVLSRAKSVEEGQRADGDSEMSYLEATLKFMPGSFACNVVWEAYFSLHPRLKTGPGKTSFSRGIQALRTVLNRFSVNNRKNMFVYRDNSGNVFYLRLHENVRSLSKLTPPGGIGRSDTEDNLPGPVSRSSSIASLNARRPTSGVIIPISSTGASEDTSNQGDGRPRLRSFGEKEVTVPSSSTGLSSLTGLSSSEGNAATPTPCVTPQPILSRSEDTIILKVHGISEAGPEVKEELVQVLQNRLDDAVLEVLSVMLARNPMCKLAPDDVHFIQKPFKSPESVIQFCIQSHALPYLQALAYYIRQNLLQFLYIPKYTDPRPECHFQDYSEPENSAKRVLEGDLFLYNQSSGSGSKGIACIAMAVVDGNGELVRNDQYPKPSSYAHLQAVNCSEFEALTSTNLYESWSEQQEPVPVLEFRIWKQGRVNLESLTQKLRSSVRHATWDLLMEFRFLTAPVTVIPHQPSVSPRILQICTSASAASSAVTSPSSVVHPAPSSEPPTPSRAKKQAKPIEFLEQISPSLIESQIQAVPPGKRTKLDALDYGEAGEVHEMYRDTMQPWLDFGVELGVPSVRKHTVMLSSRHSLPIMVREMQSLVTLNASDTYAMVFWSRPSSNKEGTITYVPGHAKTALGETLTCLMIGRNITQWKACVTDDIAFDPDMLDPKAQKVFQKFAPLLIMHSNGEKPPQFVPRQRLFMALLTDLQITLYTYNWSKERVENLHSQITQLGHWLSARSSLLTSIITQKMGLFHNQELMRKQHSTVPSSSSGSFSDGITPATMVKPSVHKASNPYLFNIGDVEQLVKFPVGANATHKEVNSRRSATNVVLSPTVTWRDVFRDGKPRRPVTKNPQNTDPVVHHVQQMLDARQADRKEEQKKLYVMWQTRGATPNIPLAEDIIQLFKQNSRVFHYCLTPLLFLPQWRVQSAATRDHTLTTVPVASRTQLVHRTRHPSANSSVSVPSVHGSASSPTLRKSSEEKWHRELCANFVHEYKQYLQTLGFIPIQTEPASPRKGVKTTANNLKPQGQSVTSSKEMEEKRGHSTKHQEKNICYLQKSLLGGILLFEILLCEPFFHAKLHALECSRLQSKSSAALISQFILSFLDECDKIKVMMHLHSFTYDYHLRCIHGYVSGRQALLKQGYHLTHFLDDFLKYYSKAPNFARNLVYADNLTVPQVTTPARQLFNYLLSHEKVYKMEVFRMVPVLVTSLGENEENDLESEDNEYVLVQLESTPHLTYKDVHDMKHTDDFDATLIIAHDREDEVDQNNLHIKYYIILTSRRELYPKLEMERKLGKFCTVSTACVTTPLQPEHSGCAGEIDDVNSENDGTSIESGTNKSQLDCQAEPNAQSEAEPNPEQQVIDNVLEGNSSPENNLESNPEQVASEPTPMHHIEIRQEAVNYLGYYSSHEQLMQELILEQAASAKRRIHSMVSQGMVHCRTHLLWNKLQCSPSRDVDRRRERDRESDAAREMLSLHGLNYAEFCELRNLAVVEPLSQLDPRLSPLLCQPLTWYHGLAKVLMAKYADHYRVFNAPDNSVQHVVVLHPRYLEAFMMLSLDFSSARGDLAVVYQKPLPSREHGTDRERLEFCLADIQSLVEGFVNACCFHLWVGLL